MVGKIGKRWMERSKVRFALAADLKNLIAASPKPPRASNTKGMNLALQRLIAS
jgi:hypothetical protein